MNDLKGKHVVITGGSRGIGAAIADHFDQAGASITLVGRSLKRLDHKLAELHSARAEVIDVTDEAAVIRGFSQIKKQSGDVDILVNNAGAADSSPFHQLSSDAWHNMISSNLHSAYFCTRQVIDEMRHNHWGRIINIASTAGLIAYRYVSAYCAAKHGVIGLTKSLALELARSGITVNAICPGFTNTDLTEESIRHIMEKTAMSKDQAAASLKRHNPQQRLIEPDEIANSAIWLCRAGTESVTGQAITIAGGEVM